VRPPSLEPGNTENSEKVRRSESRTIARSDKPGVMRDQVLELLRIPRGQSRAPNERIRALSNTRGKVELFDERVGIIMTKDDIQLLFESTAGRTTCIASSLHPQPEEFTRDLAQLPFCARHAVHIVGVERGWLTVGRNVPAPFVKVTGHDNGLFNPNAFPDLARSVKWRNRERKSSL